MKNIINILLICIIFLTWIYSVNAQTYWRVNTNTFILNNWYDLGKIIPKWYYFTPQVEYTDAEGVKNRLLQWFNYQRSFYEPRHVNEKLVNWENPYIKIEWNRPYFVTSLSKIKRILKGYLFAYRTDNWIKWMDAKDFTPAFLTWYKTASKQSIIIYPIKHKITKKVLWFIQYPCGNLVCKDDMCSELNIQPTCWDWVTNLEVWEECDYRDPNTRKGCTQKCKYEEKTCSVYNQRWTEIYTTIKPTIYVKKDSYVDIEKVYINKQPFDTYRDANKDFLDEWKYTLNAIWVNKYSNKKFLCNSSSFNVVKEKFCWDGIVNNDEQCDYNNPKTKDVCTRNCKYANVSCRISWSRYNSTPFILWEEYKISKNDGYDISKITLNNKDISNNFDNYSISKDWKYKLEVTISNNITKIEEKCDIDFEFTKRQFCWDGIVNNNEQCDDWNKDSWDGCSSICKYETASCSIYSSKREVYSWTSYLDFIKLSYKWEVNEIKISDGTKYNNKNDFMNAKINTSNCKSTKTIFLKTYNPINNSISETCEKKITILPKLSCWDWIITKSLWEECDYNDPYSGLFCNTSCKLKTNTKCELITKELVVWERWMVWIKVDNHSYPYKLEFNWKKYTSRNWFFTIQPKNTWSFNAILYTKNIFWSTRDLTTCEINIKVKDNTCN